VCTAVLTTALGARQDERWKALEAQIDRIYAQNEYSLPRFGPARWLEDGTAYTTVERGTGQAGGSDIVRYDAATGARSILIANTQLIPAGTEHALPIDDYVWSDDGSKLLIFTNTKKVWRQNTRGDYWVLTLKDGALKQVGASQPPASLMFAKFSPDATRVGYVRGNNVYVERLDDGKGDAAHERRIGNDHQRHHRLHEEEFGLRDAFRFSPDGKSVAYYQFDSAGVGIFSLINNTDSLYPVITKIPYPKAGTINSAVRIGVVSADGGPTTWIKTGGRPAQHLPGADWLDRFEHRLDPAAQSAAESQRLPDGRHQERRGQARVP
jgi:dipeptidyl-peptidase-4